MKKIVSISMLTTMLTLAPVVAQAAPETYLIDNSHTFPSFSYNHWGYSLQTSRFNKTSGKLVLDKVAKTGAVDVTIDMKSVDTGSDKFNEHIQSEDFLDTAQFPTATFKSSAVRFDGERPTAIEGSLTIKGVSKPVTLKISAFKAMLHPMLKKEALGANAVTTIKRSEFNAGKYAPNVGDEVTIQIAIEAVKE